MANYCCVCQKKFGFFEIPYVIIDTVPDYVLCEGCNIKRGLLLNSSCESKKDNYAHFQKLIERQDTPTAIRDYFLELANKDDVIAERQAKLRLEQSERDEKEKAKFDAINRNLEMMMLTTSHNFDGYSIVKYIDVICEEVIFKNSFVNQISATFSDFKDSFSFKEKELSGSSKLIDRAREYVKQEFRKKAASLGANAVIGIDFESSIGNDIVRVAIFGTAVIVKKV